jgi:general secretion pathway protein F
VFPELYRATVSAGEQSGHLDTVLERLADYTESREQLRSRTLTQCSIPCLFVVCVSIVAMLLTFVVRRSSSSSRTRGELPFLDADSDRDLRFLRNWGLLALVVVIWRSSLSPRSARPPARRRFHSFLLSAA